MGRMNLAAAAAVALTLAGAPLLAQTYSDSYAFLKGVRERDAAVQAIERVLADGDADRTAALMGSLLSAATFVDRASVEAVSASPGTNQATAVT